MKSISCRTKHTLSKTAKIIATSRHEKVHKKSILTTDFGYRLLINNMHPATVDTKDNW